MHTYIYVVQLQYFNLVTMPHPHEHINQLALLSIDEDCDLVSDDPRKSLLDLETDPLNPTFKERVIRAPSQVKHNLQSLADTFKRRVLRINPNPYTKLE